MALSFIILIMILKINIIINISTPTFILIIILTLNIIINITNENNIHNTKNNTDHDELQNKPNNFATNDERYFPPPQSKPLTQAHPKSNVAM